MKSRDILFLVLLIISICVIGFLISVPIGLLLEGNYNSKTLLQMGIFIPASIVAYIHLYNSYAKSKLITQKMLFTVIGYIVLFPIAFAVVVMLASVMF